MLDGLNPFASRFAHALIERYPEWRQFARADGPDAPVPGALSVSIPAPDVGRPQLEIEADDEEVTLYYDRWHAHYNDWTGGTESEAFAQAFGDLDRLIREEAVVAVDWEEGKWAGSMFAAPHELSPLREGRSRYVRSWHGTFNSGDAAV